MELHIYFDYTCPFCCISERQLKAALESFQGIETVWHPFELHPKPTDRPEIKPDPETGLLWDPALAAAAEDEGITLRTPFSPLPYTNLAFQGMHWVADIGGDVMAYNERVFKAVFEEGRDISDIGVLARVAKSIGLDAAALGSALKEKTFSETQQKALRHAYIESGVEEVPTYKLMGLKISGAVGRDVMKKFLGDGLKEKEKADRAADGANEGP